MKTILIILLIYLIQVLASVILNAINPSRIPTGIWDFIKLTFFPYVAYWFIYDRKKLKRKSLIHKS